ncbi:MAG: hypothetical protein FJZ47_21600, partial [Candidatus Tectomicrobia bacterium]|nr:hypothetical protein [Candidatus Tectomicrobia bacterium]
KTPCLDTLFYYSSAADLIIFSKAQWDKDGEMSYESKPAGTGPYLFKERQLGRYFLYERAPTPHWKHGTVDWKELQMTSTLEEPTRQAQLLAGETHLTEVKNRARPMYVHGGLDHGIGHLIELTSELRLGSRPKRHGNRGATSSSFALHCSQGRDCGTGGRSGDGNPSGPSGQGQAPGALGAESTGCPAGPVGPARSAGGLPTASRQGA